ncbi:hypothetical protein [Enterococcus faecium]|uniref:hypothetical protein n=1 Tax=Enterococcus faecium TaxID=1352 RepID=UPI000CFD89DC|nr:hypothetical protein [Enterococcus faecium]PQW01954.1 hypothetical protein CWC54_00665 [Enterococcus faecium]
MTYTHLTTDELVIIESYFKMNQSVAKTAHCLNRSRQTIHKVYLFFKQGKSALEYYQQYKKNNVNDIAIYFADPGTPSQRGLNENSNGLLRRDGLLKSMDFNSVDEFFIQSVASKRNNIPRKSLDYRTPLEVFLSYVSIDDLSNLI